MLRKIRVAALCACLAAASGTAEAMGVFPSRGEARSERPAEPPRTGVLGFEEAYRQALRQAEAVEIGRERVEEAQGRVYQALQTILPQADFQMSRFEQDVDDDASGSPEGVGGTLLRRTTPLRKFTFSQPIFSGFKEFAALAAAGADRKKQEWDYRRAKELLLVDVAEAYYTHRESVEDAKILEETRHVIEERIRELDERIRLGRSREGERQTSLSDLRLVEAELARSRRVQATTRQLLEFYLGRALDAELEIPPSETVPDELRYLALRDQRSDVRSAEENLRLYEQNVTAARSGFFPTAKAEGNYYTHRVGFQSGVDWDVTVSVDVPLFDGLDTVAQVKQAAAQRRIAELELEQTRRLADLDIRNQHVAYCTLAEEERARLAAAEASRENYRLQSEDYRLNLVSNLDVLDALRHYQEVRRSWNQTLHELHRQRWRLRAAAGELPGEGEDA